MTLSSMTGFARSRGENDAFRWNWEIKSVNNKGLEVRTRIPMFLDGFDLALKREASGQLARGSVFVTLSVDATEDREAFTVYENRLKHLVEISEDYADRYGLDTVRLDGLLAIKGVVELSAKEMDEDTRSDLEATLMKDFKVLLNDLKQARRDEGQHIQAVLMQQLADMRSLIENAVTVAGDRIIAMQQRFESQLAKLTSADKPVSDDRLAQEVAMLAVKSDIQEEIDRLNAHFDEAEKLLKGDKPVGRRLDFLCQEFNREANTLCSKSGDTALTRIGLDLKVLIDQFREQVQNIE